MSLFSRFRRWLFPDAPGVLALREAARMLGDARRLVAKTTSTVAILRERANDGENAVNEHAHAHRELRAMRRDLEKMERRFEELQATAGACGVSEHIVAPSYATVDLRDEAERDLALEEAELELERELRM